MFVRRVSGVDEWCGVVFAQEAKLMEALPNIYCMVDPTGNGANSTFITTKEGVIVIDTRGNETEAGQVLKAIRKATDQPVVYVVNSHFHKENISGNGVFKSARTIIAQKRALAMIVLEAEREKRKVTPANLAFEKKLELKLGKYHLKLIHPGPAHTDGDLYIYIPKWRILITGGMVFNRIIPFLGDGNIESWIHALRGNGRPRCRSDRARSWTRRRQADRHPDETLPHGTETVRQRRAGRPTKTCPTPSPSSKKNSKRNTPAGNISSGSMKTSSAPTSNTAPNAGT